MAISAKTKRLRRIERHRSQRFWEAKLAQSVMGRGSPVFCGGARPSQIRAAAKQVSRLRMTF